MAAAPLSVPRMKPGSQGLEVSAQGLGCMGMSAFYGPPKPEPDMIALIHHAVASGVTFLDTSDMYGPHTNEILLGKALQGGVRQKVELATKFGVLFADGKREIRGDPAYVRAPCEGSLKRLGVDCIDLYYQHRIDKRVPIELRTESRDGFRLLPRSGDSSIRSSGVRPCSCPVLDEPAAKGRDTYVRAACEGSLKRLGVDCIDLYYQHRIDKRVPIEITIGELKKLVEEGKIKYIGLSEASASTIRRAHAVHPITAVQLEWSLWSRDVEEDIIPTCRELGIGIVAYSPLGQGFLSSGPKLIDSLSEQDFRRNMPRLRPENLEQNVKIFELVNAMAAKKGCTPSQLALAWVHHQGNDVCPIPGTTKIDNFNQNVGALSVTLTPDEMADLESYTAAGEVQGDRYPTMANTWRDSETPQLSSWKSE